MEGHGSLGWFLNLDVVEAICFDHYANEVLECLTLSLRCPSSCIED